jgi:hypothetical protein
MSCEVLLVPAIKAWNKDRSLQKLACFPLLDQKIVPDLVKGKVTDRRGYETAFEGNTNHRDYVQGASFSPSALPPNNKQWTIITKGLLKRLGVQGVQDFAFDLEASDGAKSVVYLNATCPKSFTVDKTNAEQSTRTACMTAIKKYGAQRKKDGASGDMVGWGHRITTLDEGVLSPPKYSPKSPALPSPNMTQTKQPSPKKTRKRRKKSRRGYGGNGQRIPGSLPTSCSFMASIFGEFVELGWQEMLDSTPWLACGHDTPSTFAMSCNLSNPPHRDVHDGSRSFACWVTEQGSSRPIATAAWFLFPDHGIAIEIPNQGEALGVVVN